MKNKKWLLVIVISVFVINLAFWVLTRVARLDQLIQSKASTYLAELLQADVEIGYFTFNDKQANISNISIQENNSLYQLDIEQIYVEYDLPKLLFSRFRNLKAIRQITILSPVLDLNLPSEVPQEDKSVSSEKAEDEEFLLPLMENFFSKLTLKEGTVNFAFDSQHVELKQTWQDLNIEIINDKKTEIVLSARSDSSELSAHSILQAGQVFSSQLNISNFFPDYLRITAVDSLRGKINLTANYSAAMGLDYSGAINNFFVSSYQRDLSTDKLGFAGNLQQAEVNSILNADGNKLILAATLNDLLQTKRSISAQLHLPEIDSQRYWPELSGEVSASVQVSGSLHRPDISVQAEAHDITAYQQQIPYISASGEVGYDKIDFTLHKFEWEDNLFSGFGVYDYQTGLSAELTIPSFRYQQDQHTLQAALKAYISYHDILKADLALSDLVLSSDDLVLDQLNLQASLLDDKFQLNLTRPTKDISLDISSDLRGDNASASLNFSRFDLNRYFQKYDLPLLSGNLDLQKILSDISLVSSLRIFDQDFGKLDGQLMTEAALNLETEKLSLNFETDNTKFNYEPFEIKFAATGDFGQIKTDNFIINDEIFLNLWLDNSDTLQYGMKIAGQQVKLKNYLKYVIHSYTANQIEGELDLDLNFDSRLTQSIRGSAQLSDFSYGAMEKLQAEMLVSGDLDSLDLHTFQIKHQDKSLVDLGGYIQPLADFAYDLKGKITALNLHEILTNSPVQGDIFADFNYQKNSEDSHFDLDLQADDLLISNQKVDSLRLAISQFPQFLQVTKLQANSKKYFDLQGQGEIGYNFFTSTAFPDSHNFYLNFSGDLFRMLARELDFINNGRSRSSIDLNLGIAENGFSVQAGKIEIDKAFLDITDQLVPIDKVNVLLDFTDNKLAIEEFNFRFGEGRLYIENEIAKEDNFILGKLNLGIFKVHTSDSGILLHMPGFMPSNSFAKVEIRGREEPELLVSGPFEDTKILGNVVLSNGDAIFPPDTENVMKLFGKMRANTQKKVVFEEKEIEQKDLPFSLDLIVDLQENVRYVTYPANLKISSDSFLQLKYEAGEFKIPEAFFLVEEGSADIFGTQMKTDYFRIQINEFQQGVEIVGNFYKQAADGTIITFEIYDDSEGSDEMNLQFQLVSDNSSDGILDILSLLRYGRRVDDIAEGQKKTLLQDEVVNIIGVGLESALLDPLISPVENWIRNSLRLDFFYLSTDLVQNVVSNFITSSDEQLLTTNEPGQDLGSLAYDDFLDNLSINAGKYLTRRLFFDYEARIEKSFDLNYRSQIGVYQYYSLRYDMPLQFRLIYQYNLQPFDENAHQITLQKSFRF